MNTTRFLRAITGLGRRVVFQRATLITPAVSWSVTRSVRMAWRTSPVRLLQSDSQLRSDNESVVDIFRTLTEAKICTTYVLTELFRQVLTDSKMTDEEVKQTVELFHNHSGLAAWIRVILSLSLNNNLRELGNSLVRGLIDNPDLIAKYDLRPHQAFLEYIVDEPEESEFTKLVVDFVKQVDTNSLGYYDEQALRRSNYRLWKAVRSPVKDEEFQDVDFVSPLKLQSFIAYPTAAKLTDVLTQIYDPGVQDKGADIRIIDSNFTKLLNLLRKKELSLCQNTVGVIEWWWKLLPIEGREASRDTLESSACRICGKEIEEADIRESDLNLLRIDFLENLKCDAERMYATRADYELYLKFLDKHEKKTNERFDCVIDLMNIIYSTTKYQQSRRFRLFLPTLRVIVKKYNLKQILMIAKVGRSTFEFHQFEVAKQDFKNMGVDLTLFVAPGQSKDDLFILDAACWSGPQCFVVSSDHFRQHLALINNRRIFEKWLKARRLLVGRTMDLFSPPTLVKYEIQGSSEKGWHIPYFDSRFSENTPFHKQWLCLQRKK